MTVTSARAAPAPDFPNAIALARAARDRAIAVRPPSAADFAAAASDEAIAGILQSWAASRRDAAQDAHRAYAEALRAVQNASDEARTYGEIAEVWLRVEEDTRAALFAATPAEYRDDPSLVGAVQGATVYALRPLLDRVGSNLAACERIANEPSAEGTPATACAAVNERYERSRDPWMRPAEAREAPTPSASAPRPVLATTHPKPCTFKGTLLTRGAVYDRESGGSVLLSIEPGLPIEVESLAASSKAGGRYKVTVTWPKAVEGYLDAEDAPFVVTRAVEIGPDAVWAAEGERVAASGALGPTVRAERAADGRAGSDASGTTERRLFCHDLALATSAARRQ